MQKNRANSFDHFIIEAYIDPEGELQDFSISKEDELKFDTDVQIESIKDSLRLDGANEVKVQVGDDYNKLRFKFEYSGNYYSIALNIDDNFAAVIRVRSGRAPNLIYTGSMDSLFDLLENSGLYGLLGH